MKKIYFLASMLMVGGVASAQQSGIVMKASPVINHSAPAHNTASQDRAPGDVIGSYSDDFSVPGNWNLANTGSPSINFTINGLGPASAPANITSTSGGNFAWYDCDPQGTGSTVDATLTYGSTFNLTANAAVMVQFEQYYMDYYTDCYVEVSTNGLAGPWTQYEVNAAYLPNSFSSTSPVLTQVNISSQAGGQANVAVRFHYVGGWGWSWQIDDFALVEAYENELEMTYSKFSSGTEGNEYYAIPTTQITEFTFGSRIKSNGVISQTGVVMDVEVDGGAEYSGTSSQSLTLTENQTDTFSIITPNGWTPSGNGSYDLVIMSNANETEQLPANNDVAHEPIVVGGLVYARDNGIISGGFSGFTSTVGEPLQIGNTFEFFADEVFGKVQIGLTTAAASEGQLMFASVYIWDGTDFVYETQSADYTVTASDLGAIVELQLGSNVNAVTGDIILVCAGHYGGTTPTSFAEAQATATNTVLAMSVGGLIGGSDPSAIIVRPVFEISEVGFEEELTATGLNIFPNPADKSTMLSYNLANESNVMLTLVDLTGKVVYTENFGSQVEGQYNVDLNTAELSNGVYFYSLTVGEQKLTKKFVVSH